METRKHKRVTSGIPGSVCMICKDQTVFSDSSYETHFSEAHDSKLSERHTVIKTEAHIWQNTVEGSDPYTCEHCGHDESYPLHRDFSDYDEMLADFRKRRDDRDRKISYEEFRSSQPATTSGYSHRWWSYFLTFVGGSAVMGVIASLTGW